MAATRRAPLGLFGVALLAAAFLTGCQTTPPYLAPIPSEVLQQIAAIGSTPNSPIYIRIFKEESELEVWKQRADGQYALLKTYAICAWSGTLGPKLAEGDRQAPEGFYAISPAQLNPNSDLYLAFNLGYPNTFDQALGRTGSFLMVHGGCSSAGCYAMTDPQIEEIYALAREAFLGGQRSFDVHAFPFRMTPENLARHRDNPNMPFWEMLKVGYDHFEVTQRVPSVAVCDFGYVFDAEAPGAAFTAAAACPPYQVPEAIAIAVAEKQAADNDALIAAIGRLEIEAQIAVAAAEGTGPATPIPAAAATTIAAAAAPEPRTMFQRFFGTR